MKENPRAEARLNRKVNVLHKTFLQDWKRWLFYLLYRNHHREPRKMKRQRNMFPMKEQDNTSGRRP